MKAANAAARAFRTILCPVDFSDASRVALQFAGAVAERFRGKLVVLFVNDPLLVAAAAAAYDERGLAATTMKELGRFVERALKGRGGPSPSCRVALGNPAREILKAAKRLRCDAIVMGTSGAGAAGRFFFGSTTERVMRSATLPVLAVPPVKRRPRASR